MRHRGRNLGHWPHRPCPSWEPTQRQIKCIRLKPGHTEGSCNVCHKESTRMLDIGVYMVRFCEACFETLRREVSGDAALDYMTVENRGSL